MAEPPKLSTTRSNNEKGHGKYNASNVANNDESNNESNEISVIINGCVNKVNSNKFENKYVPVWFEKYTPSIRGRTSALKRVKADNRTANATSLPVLSVSNMRSLLPKIQNFAEDMIHREIQVALLCEIWEKSSNKRYQQEIERMLEMNGLKYISCPRAGGRTGGGVGVVANIEFFSCQKIDMTIPHNLEIIWTMVRPKNPTQGLEIKEIICASFYSPPKSRKNSKMIDHIITTVHYLQSSYPKACFILGGDKNKLPLAPLLDGLPGFFQIVTKVTHKENILDVIMTNFPQLFSNPVTVPPVQPDDPKNGKPSDHLTVIAVPLNKAQNPISREYHYITVRPIPESKKQIFGNWLENNDWSWLEEKCDPSPQVEEWERRVHNKLDEICPTKKVKLNNRDKPFFTGDLKDEFRRLCRSYRKTGKSKLFLDRKLKFNENYKKAAAKYLKKNVASILNDNPGKASRVLKQVGARPGDCQLGGSFRLSNHSEQNLTIEESIERYVEHFALVSQEFEPLNFEKLPPNVKKSVEEDLNLRPCLTEFQVWDKLKSMKRTKSSVPGDLPPNLRKMEELVKPITLILNNIIESGIWPEKWKVEHGTPIPKNDDKMDEDDTRIISITNHLSKLMEKFVFQWLLQFIGHKLDEDQYGATQGSSITHYLIELINFILFNQDFKSPKAVLALMVDLSISFNRVDHNYIVIILHEMGTPGWLLKIVISFLLNRKLKVRPPMNYSWTPNLHCSL